MVKKKENVIVKWLQQRRLWAAVFSAVAVVGVSSGYPQVAQGCTVLAGVLGLHSYIKPKK